MKKTLIYIGFAIGAAFLASAFAWAAFDIRWWTPLETNDRNGRGFFLVLFHVFGMIAGLAAALSWTRNGRG